MSDSLTSLYINEHAVSLKGLLRKECDGLNAVLEPHTIELPQFQSKLECHLLECFVDSSTILGIDETGQAMITVLETTSKAPPSPPPAAPRRPWRREALTSKSDDENSPTTVTWIDYHGNLTLSSQASCVYFLRSLLSTSHEASPWSNETATLPTVVAILVESLPKETLELLQHVRVNDVCPSYVWHSCTRLENLPEKLWDNDMTNIRNGTLLVYHKLPPRYHLTSLHPEDVTNTALLPMGCLWESLPVNDEDADDERERYRIVAPPYLSYEQDYPQLLEPLLKNLGTICEEAIAIPQWTAWPEKNHYSSSSENSGPTWNVFPLCHCFPANSIENKKWIQTTSQFVPQTTSLLKQHLGDTLRTALFSRLDPESVLEAHTGWEDLANHVYRLHIPLTTSPQGLCGTWVDGCVETHYTGSPLIFDDSKTHRAFNYSSKERIVLILDLVRPSHLPEGTAVGGHTDELDEFIQSVS